MIIGDDVTVIGINNAAARADNHLRSLHAARAIPVIKAESPHILNVADEYHRRRNILPHGNGGLITASFGQSGAVQIQNWRFCIDRLVVRNIAHRRPRLGQLLAANRPGHAGANHRANQASHHKH